MKSKIIKFIMLICLPVEGMAAVAMPNCQMHDTQQMQVNADMSNMDDMAHCDHHDSAKPAKNVTCDKCLPCHLSVAQAIIPFNTPLEFSGALPMYSTDISEVPDTVPPSLFHPPRQTFA
ncbi:MAG: hypothetical protein CTY32_07125 [Methylotenera sp.]|nr:MAG: hypothetical protein CTY32_07125 [Methylotenera sp.]